ncbi:hypothetical protein HYY74_05145 [Candidatus Woesearchaeota archaeon]|nr:hypothetical protein [Candidatus Woesearchaeota archaeon]
MKRAFFDTSVYGELIDNDTHLGLVAQKAGVRLRIFGSTTVRRELEAVPDITLVTRGRFRGLGLRQLIVMLYNQLIATGGEISDNDLIEVLSLRYKIECSKLRTSKKDMMNDFRIVAAACMHNMRIFASADKQQLSYEPLFREINASYQLDTPEFVPYASLITNLKNEQEGGDSEE